MQKKNNYHLLRIKLLPGGSPWVFHIYVCLTKGNRKRPEILTQIRIGTIGGIVQGLGLEISAALSAAFLGQPCIHSPQAMT